MRLSNRLWWLWWLAAAVCLFVAMFTGDRAGYESVASITVIRFAWIAGIICFVVGAVLLARRGWSKAASWYER